MSAPYIGPLRSVLTIIVSCSVPDPGTLAIAKQGNRGDFPAGSHPPLLWKTLLPVVAIDFTTPQTKVSAFVSPSVTKKADNNKTVGNIGLGDIIDLSTTTDFAANNIKDNPTKPDWTAKSVPLYDLTNDNKWSIKIVPEVFNLTTTSIVPKEPPKSWQNGQSQRTGQEEQLKEQE